MIKVLIAEDQKLLSESLKNIIEHNGDIEVVGCAANGLEAFNMCIELQPDLVLMDLKMPVCDGVQGTRLIKEKNDKIKVIILTTFDDDDNITNALEKGADGYILKDILPEELIMVIKNAVRGFHVLSPKTYKTISKHLIKNKEAMGERETNKKISVLNDTELQILYLIADGKNNKEIAAAIYLSEGRVKNIISDIFSKLKLKDRYQLLSYAYKNNIIE